MTDEPDLIITAAELKRVGFCYSRQLEWFRARGWDFKKHLDGGTSASLLLGTGDGFAIKGVQLVKALRNG